MSHFDNDDTQKRASTYTGEHARIAKQRAQEQENEVKQAFSLWSSLEPVDDQELTASQQAIEALLLGLDTRKTGPLQRFDSDNGGAAVCA